MNSRERLQKALNHEEADKLPVDFGATPVSGMHTVCIEGLRDYYGLEKRPIKVIDPYQMLGLIEDDLMDAIGIDVYGIAPRNNMFGFANEDWKPWQTPWGQEVLVGGDFTVTETENDVLIYPQGDKSVEPSGRMSKACYFFDSIMRQPPINEEELNPEDNLEEFAPLSDEDIRFFSDEIDRLSGKGRGIIANMGGTAFGDIALVPGPFLKHPKGIRDVAEWYMSTAMRQEYIHEVFSKESDIALENLKKFHEVMGDRIDAFYVCGTDFGMQEGTFCSEETFENLYAPYYKKVNNWIHENTSWKTFKHCCGSIISFMSNFIEAGFDIINPVQCSAAGMDPVTLKKEYGERIVFWGGGVDTQNTLPFGSKEDVRKEVLSRCEIFNKGGGYVFNTIHNIQANVPLENIVAMIDAVKEYNGDL